MIDNFALYMFYVVPGIIGALVWKKNRVIGFFGGLIVAFIAITFFALSMGG